MRPGFVRMHLSMQASGSKVERELFVLVVIVVFCSWQKPSDMTHLQLTWVRELSWEYSSGVSSSTKEVGRQ